MTDLVLVLLGNVAILAIVALSLAANWKVLLKAGQSGWGTIVPIYQIVLLVRIAGWRRLWFLGLLIPFAGTIFYFFLCIDLARSFGKGWRFALGLFFLPYIFFLILGFGSTQYLGPSGAHAPDPKALLPFFTLMALFVLLSIASPHFLTAINLSSVVRQTAVINIMALGMTLVIVSGGIDLSVGAILAFAGTMGTMCMVAGWGMGTGMLAAVLCGALWGFVNGFLTVSLKIPPFIVTLGTLGIARGVTLIISGGLPVSGLPDEFRFLGEGTIGPVPTVLPVLLVCAALTYVVLHSTKLGRYTYAIGSNKAAAIYAGIPVAGYTIAVYAISGMLTGVSSMIEASRLMTGQPTAGQGYELQVIAAVVIGGGSLAGGEGSVVGTLIGAFLMGLLSNGSDLLGINPYVQQAIIGAVIIIAVALDEARKRRFSA